MLEDLANAVKKRREKLGISEPANGVNGHSQSQPRAQNGEINGVDGNGHHEPRGRIVDGDSGRMI